jgi:putative transposase
MCENRHSLPGVRVVQVLERVAQERGLPEAIQVDNGPEFISRVVDQWAYASGVTLHFIDPSKPVQNDIHRKLQRKVSR